MAAISPALHADRSSSTAGAATTACSAAAAWTSSTAARATTTSSPATRAPEQVNCGDANDTAITDDADVRVSCEEIEGDADSDGVRRPADCDDTQPGIRPGVADVPENGVDEDCSGVDAVNRDRDGDGSPRPQDCDDDNAAVRPGTREVIGNGVDENCDTRVEPFPPLTGSVSSAWSKVGRRTRNLTLIARDFPAGTRIALRCRGPRCPPGAVVRRVRSATRPVDLHVSLGGARSAGRSGWSSASPARTGWAACCAIACARPGRRTSSSSACRPAAPRAPAEPPTRGRAACR